jgi:hypothetical protein
MTGLTPEQRLEIRRRAIPLTGNPSQYDALLDGIGDARIVLLGEPLERSVAWEAGEVAETYPSGL